LASIDYLETLGISRNPFDPAPLDATAVDMKLFVGRDNEIRQLKTKLKSTPNGLYRIVLMGTYGVGKTSLLNRMFYEADNDDKWKFATVKLAGKEDMTFLDFMLIMMDKLADDLDKVEMKKTDKKIIEEIKLNLNFSRQVGTETSSEISGTINAMVASLASKLGVKESEIRTPLPWNERSAMKDLQTTIDVVLRYYNGIVCGIDEVDYLTSRVSREVLKKGREEIFQHRNFLFVFSGTTRFRALLEEIGSPIREIIDNFIILEPFRYPEERNMLTEMVDLRLENVIIKGKSTQCPFDKESMELIFTLSNGVPRRILRFLQASLDSGIQSKKIVDTELVLSTIRELGRGHFSGLALKERDIVKLLAKKELINEGDFEEVKTRFSLSDETLKKIISSLESQGILNAVFAGKDVCYTLAPEIRVYVLHEFKLATPIYQIEAAQKLTQTITDEQDPNVRRAHLKTAYILESQGHLGLLNIEFDSMRKEEKISHADKALACMTNLSDPKINSSIEILQQVLANIKEGKSNKEIKDTLLRAISMMKEYAKTIFEPSQTGKRGHIIFSPVDEKGRSMTIELDEPVSYRTLVMYQALMRDFVDSKMTVKIKDIQPNSNKIKEKNEETKKQEEKKKTRFAWLTKKKKT
jgi:hypothetical protein